MAKSYKIIATAAILASAWFIPWLAFYLLKPASLMAVNPVFEFGTISPGTIVKHVFVVRNTGNRSLEISRIIPGCSCTVASISKARLGRGETAYVDISLNTSAQYGSVYKEIAVISNAPATPLIRLALSGQVQFSITPESKTVNFQYSPADQWCSKRFELELSGNAKEVHLGIHKVEIPYYIDVQTQTLHDGKCEVLCRLNAIKAPKNFSATIFLYSDNHKIPPYPFYLHGECTGSLTAIPTTLYFGILRPGQECTRGTTISIVGESGKKPTLLGTPRVECNGASIAVSQGSAAIGATELDIHITVNAGIRPGTAIAGRVEVLDIQGNALDIPIVAYVAKD